jgi:cobyrinic acid a,c-diamide synthase
MCGRDHSTRLFARACADADVAIVEGVMGLFDGAAASGLEGCTAEMALWLDAPVLLVASARGMARSYAALMHGFTSFEPAVRIAGAIANFCGGEAHAQALRASLDSMPLVGWLSSGMLPELASRHLGLVSASEQPLEAGRWVDVVERQLDVDAILALAQQAAPLPAPPGVVEAVPRVVRIGVARDAAFQFYYADHLAALERAGAELVPFSPLADNALPPGLAGLYFGGGYPEIHAAALAENTPLRSAVRRFAASGRPVYAECGGLMYLSSSITTRDGACHPMAGVLPAATRMLARRKALGYVEAEIVADGPLGRRGSTLRGHEYHYSELAADGIWTPAYRTRRRRDGALAPEGFLRGNVFASYVHTHFGAYPAAAQQFVTTCQEEHHD